MPLLHDSGFDDVRTATANDLGVLAEAITELERSPAENYLPAMACYERADAAFDRAREPEDFEEVTKAIREGLFLCNRLRAGLAHTLLPEQLQPCFFDPAHGPAAGYIAWTPLGLEPRTVPVCAEDRAIVERDEQPEPRHVLVDRRSVPFWDAPDAFAPWFSGYFRSVDGCRAADMLEGFALGSVFAELATRTDDGVITSDEIFKPLPGADRS